MIVYSYNIIVFQSIDGCLKFINSFVVYLGNKPVNMKISRLHSGGLITNYYCTSRCAHCLYACSPFWSKQYITPGTVRNNFRKIKSLGCFSIHIGGGEPLLQPDRLAETLEIADEEGINIEYVETNSSWFREETSTIQLLKRLKESGLTMLLISISPFHNQYIPFYKVKGVINASRKAGVAIFAWIEEFYHEIDRFSDKETHHLDEYRQMFGEDYVKMIPGRYWVHLGGRAIQTYRDVFELKSLDVILENTAGCHELTDTSHFHVDLFDNYIPGLCSGLSVRIDDLGKELISDVYPIISILYREGIKGFYEYAKSEYQFRPAEKYLNKCHLCNDIRSYLVLGKKLRSTELQPEEYYQNV